MTYEKSHQSTLNYHAAMLHDAARIEAFRSAIHQAVSPGDVVVDLGCGSGILSIIACQAGASRVYAIENGPIIEIARRIAETNGFDDRITFVQGLSTAVSLPELGDVLVTETIGNIGLEEGICGYVADAARRLIKPGGKILPERLALHLVPIRSPELYKPIEAWRQPVCGLDLSAGAGFAANNVHWVKLDEASFISRPQQLCQLQMQADCSAKLDMSAEFEIECSGPVHGFGGWFSAETGGGSSISTAPPIAWSSWAHAFFPLATLVHVPAGSRMILRLGVAANGGIWTWRWRLKTRPGSQDKWELGPEHVQSSFHGSYGKLAAPAV